VTEALKAIRGPLFGLFLAAVDRSNARRCQKFAES
jgi:hypothetical protein